MGHGGGEDVGAGLGDLIDQTKAEKLRRNCNLTPTVPDCPDRDLELSDFLME
jgi:hypothetical protein